MRLSAGAGLWLPCAVSPGPFSDERVIVGRADDNEWVGFVNVRWLKKHGSENTDEVLARVVDVDDSTFRARIPGNALQSGFVQGCVERAVRSDTVQA